MSTIDLGANGNDGAARQLEFDLEELLAPLSTAVRVQSLKYELLRPPAVRRAVLKDALERAWGSRVGIDVELECTLVP